MTENEMVDGVVTAVLRSETKTGEVASAAVAAKAEAIAKARYVMAYNRPRNINQARISILEACKRPAFAEAARYRKPVGGGTIDGFSIRFAEEAIKCLTNVAVESITVFEDAEKRIILVTVTDLETNVTYGEDISITKTVERKVPSKDREVISKRTNTSGVVVYLVAATEDEISNKAAAAKSKIIRNCGLRLIPSDILVEAESEIEKTLTSGGTDVKAAIKKVIDAFASLNIGPAELNKFLGHAVETVSIKELTSLRAVYSTIKDGQSSWSDYVSDAKPDKPDLTKPE
jgi:hypothetical protein